LLAINQKKGRRLFLDAVELVSKHSSEVYLGSILEIISLLKEVETSNKQVRRIFRNLIERDVKFFNDKQEWLGEKRGPK